jgi:hypothetical protein
VVKLEKIELYLSTWNSGKALEVHVTIQMTYYAIRAVPWYKVVILGRNVLRNTTEKHSRMNMLGIVLRPVASFKIFHEGHPGESGPIHH